MAGDNPKQDMTRILAKYDIFVDEVNREAVDLAKRAGTEVLDRSNEIVPSVTGALKQSGRVFVGKGKTHVSANISYGGGVRVSPTKNAPSGIVDYAVYVHEDLEAHHPQGEAKFLEKGAAIASRKVKAIITEGLRKLTRKR